MVRHLHRAAQQRKFFSSFLEYGLMYADTSWWCHCDSTPVICMKKLSQVGESCEDNICSRTMSGAKILQISSASWFPLKSKCACEHHVYNVGSWANTYILKIMMIYVGSRRLSMNCLTKQEGLIDSRQKATLQQPQNPFRNELNLDCKWQFNF